MPIIKQLSDYSQAALASYAADLIANGDNTAAYTTDKVKMTGAQAVAFNATWAVLQQSTSINGFSAVLFQNRATGEKLLSIAGTDLADPGDVITDFVNVAADGTVLGMPQYISLDSFYAQLVSSGKLGASEQITLSGHSLGGFLVQAFTARHTDIVSAAYTYNAPGFSSFESLLGFLGVTNTASAAGKITNVHATDGLSMTAGLGTMLGASQPVRIEAVANPLANHSVVILGDALAVFSAYASLQPSLTMDRIAGMFAAAGKGDSQLEATLDALRTVFIGSASNDVNRTPTGDRDRLYINLQALQNDAGFKALSGQVAVVSAPRTFASLGQADTAAALAYRYALQELLPLAVVANTEAQNQTLYGNYTQRLSLYNEATGQGELTRQWLEDRAVLLEAITSLNTKNGSGTAYSNLLPTDRSYELRWLDGEGAEQILIAENTARQGGVFKSVSSQLLRFGGEGNDVLAGSNNLLGDHLYGGAGNDTLNGLSGNDYLEGNTGEDTIDGGFGNDILRGGAGDDTYIFTGAFGSDTIVDTDGQIKIGDDLINGGKKVIENVWESEDKKYVFTQMGGNLIIGRRTASGAATVSGTITIQNWESNQLGITLNGAASPVPPARNNFIGDQHAPVITPGSGDPYYGLERHDLAS